MENIINVIIASLPEAIGALLAASMIALLSILRRKNRRLKNFDQLGVDNVYNDRKDYEHVRLKLFSKANEIKLLSIYAYLAYKDLDELIKKALQKGKKIEILIADPSANLDYIKNNIHLQLAVMSDDTPNKIRNDLRALKNIMITMKNQNWKGQLEVKLYKEEPMWSIYIFDGELYASPYLYRVEGSDTPCIHAVDKGSGRTPYAQFKRHYEKLWEYGTSVDLDKY